MKVKRKLKCPYCGKDFEDKVEPFRASRVVCSCKGVMSVSKFNGFLNINPEICEKCGKFRKNITKFKHRLLCESCIKIESKQLDLQLEDTCNRW